MGSRAIALSPDGAQRLRRLLEKRRDRDLPPQPRSGALTQAKGAAGCIAAKGADGCAKAIGLDGPNSVAVSPDGRNVYATSRGEQLDHRLPPQPQDRRADPAARRRRLHRRGCRCPAAPAAGRWSVPTWSSSAPTGRTSTSAPSSATRSPSSPATAISGALTQPGGSAGCIAEATSSGCALGIALGAPEGMAISPDGASVYVASALSNAVAVLARDPATGALTQATRRQRLHRRHRRSPAAPPAFELSGANAVGDQPQRRRLRDLAVQQQRHRLHPLQPDRRRWRRRRARPAAWSGCARSAAPSAAPSARPRGSPSRPTAGTSTSPPSPPAPIAVLDRNRRTGAVAQKPGRAGCLGAALGPRLHAGPGAARRQLDRAQPRRPLSSTRPRSAATPSTSSGGTNERTTTKRRGRADPQAAARLRRQRRGRGAAGPGRRRRAARSPPPKASDATSPG